VVAHNAAELRSQFTRVAVCQETCVASIGHEKLDDLSQVTSTGHGLIYY